MQYKLAKDLPFAKAGTEINYSWRDENHPIFKFAIDGNEHQLLYIECDEEDFGKLISEGWIEEVKPREFEIKLGENSIGLYDITNKKWIFHPFPVEPTSSIKVQEIIA